MFHHHFSITLFITPHHRIVIILCIYLSSASIIYIIIIILYPLLTLMNAIYRLHSSAVRITIYVVLEDFVLLCIWYPTGMSSIVSRMLHLFILFIIATRYSHGKLSYCHGICFCFSKPPFCLCGVLTTCCNESVPLWYKFIT